MRTLKNWVFQGLDRSGLRWLLAIAATVFMSVTRRELCLVRFADGRWLHRYADGLMPNDVIGGPTPRELVAVATDIAAWAYRPDPGDTVLDIGAGHGEEALPFSRWVGPDGSVVAVEAHPASFDRLRLLCELNKLDNVRCLQVAVADDSGQLPMSSRDNYLFNAILASNEDGVLVPARTLDDLVADLGLERIDLLKMNIEGAERLAIRGMADTLARTRHVCIACHDFIADHDPSGASETMRTKGEVSATLRTAGFEVIAREDARPWVVQDYLYGARRIADVDSRS